MYCRIYAKYRFRSTRLAVFYKKDVPKILQNSLENNSEVSFIIKVETEGIKANFYIHIIPNAGIFQVFFIFEFTRKK